MNYNWDWGILFRDPYLGWMISALGWTILISILAWIIAFSLGSILGIFRTSSKKSLRLIATCYVELFRNIPLLVQIFLWYFVFPELLTDDWSRWVKRDMPYPAFDCFYFNWALYCIKGLRTSSFWNKCCWGGSTASWSCNWYD